MANPNPTWPPKINNHRGRARVRWKGKDYYLGAYDSRESQLAYIDLLTKLSLQFTPDHTNPSVSTVVTEYCVARIREKGPDSRETENVRYACRPLVDLMGNLPANEFDTLKLEQIQLEMARRKWSRSYINASINRIRKVWRFAERRRFVPMGSWDHLRTLPGLDKSTRLACDKPKKKSITWDELQKVIAECSPTIGAMLQLQWHTGMRSGEVRIMRVQDIDTSGEVWLYTPQSHKTKHLGNHRVVLLGTESQEVLRPFLLPPQEGYIFPSKDERSCYTKDSYAQAVRRAARRAGVPHFHPYLCRHAFKMRVLAEHDAETARVLLGHKSILTQKHYGDLDLSKGIEALKRKSA